MKFSKISSIALLSASASADLASMQKLYQKVLDIKKNGTDERVRATGASTRFVPGVRFIFSMIQEYGCWCYLGDKHGAGRGQPQDSYSSIGKVQLIPFFFNVSTFPTVSSLLPFHFFTFFIFLIFSLFSLSFLFFSTHCTTAFVKNYITA